MLSIEEKPNVAVSEYEEARKRFDKLDDDDTFAIPQLFSDSEHLNEIVQKLCAGECFEVEDPASLFFEVLLYADYIQLKEELYETFYFTLCKTLIVPESMEEILMNLGYLDVIGHVKKYIVRGLLKFLQLRSAYEDDTLTLCFSQRNKWYKTNFDKAGTVQILPSAFKVMFHKELYKLSYLNFLLRFVQLDTLVLTRCNLNCKAVMGIFKGLKLKGLEMAECGTSLNDILPKLNKEIANLKHLDISQNIVLNSTLEKIRTLPLKSLNLRECIGGIRSDIKIIWLLDSFITDSEIRKVNLDTLWEAGVLKTTIKNLCISGNMLTNENLVRISKLKLYQLDISSTHNFSELDLVFPPKLKILIARSDKFNFAKFETVSKLPLVKFDFDYVANSSEEHFHRLKNCKMRHTLKDSIVCISNRVDNFLAFFSKINFERVFCILIDSLTYIDSFFHDYPHKRGCLQGFHLEGDDLNFPVDALNVVRKLTLKELSISTYDYKEDTFLRLLSCDNLQESVVSLKLSGDIVTDAILNKISKFKNLEEISFIYSESVDLKILQKVLRLERLKKIDLEAKIDGQISLEVAHLLCMAPVRILEIADSYGDGESITQEAYEFLCNDENFEKFAQKLATLNLLFNVEENVARVLRRVSWEEIILEHCCDSDECIQLLLSNENLRFSLDSVKTVESDLHWQDMAKLNLSKLEIEYPYEIHSSLLSLLKAGPLLKWLRHLLLFPKANDVTPLLRSSISRIDTMT